MFLVTAAVACKSMVKSIPENHYKLDTLSTYSNDPLCRMVAQPIAESQAYTVSAELLNQAGWKGVNSGHLGLLFNAVDNLVPRVHWLFGQQEGASRDSGIMEKIYFFDWLIIKQRERRKFH